MSIVPLRKDITCQDCWETIENCVCVGYDSSKETRARKTMVDLASMPTGPWVEGDAPAEDGWYLCQLHYGQFSLYFREDNKWHRKYTLHTHPILRHAKINEVTE